MRDSEGLKYLLTDHLGSLAAVVDASGTLLSEQRYLPFGGLRQDVGDITETDFSFTGQRGLAAVGLMDYNARWYDPLLGRFIQPDTIIPGAGNPMAFDRYAYVMNNPLSFVDPSGHVIEKALFAGEVDTIPFYDVVKSYGIVFNDGWSLKNMAIVMLGVITVGKRFSEELKGTSSSEAFKAVYGLDDEKKFYFDWNEKCWGCREDPNGCDAETTSGDACDYGFGYTNDENWIEFASLSTIDVPLRNINNVIHELGHAFNTRLSKIPENALVGRGDLLVINDGYYGYPDNRTWKPSGSSTESETFANQFLGWVYGKWGNDYLGPTRAEFMNQMNGKNGWVVKAIGLR